MQTKLIVYRMVKTAVLIMLADLVEIECRLFSFFLALGRLILLRVFFLQFAHSSKKKMLNEDSKLLADLQLECCQKNSFHYHFLILELFLQYACSLTIRVPILCISLISGNSCGYHPFLCLRIFAKLCSC